jgi:lipopolysaccharide/colanic/teichoic acid biosynthesis glycosyltransferase
MSDSMVAVDNVLVSELVAEPAMDLATRHSQTYRSLKRLLDILGASAGLVLCAPLLLVVGVLIKWHDGGPVFFIQQRVGRNGKLFPCFKLRTMVPNAEQLKASLMDSNVHQDSRTFKMEYDPRITPIGRRLRAWSIDEVPQFINVLRGEMSLVGPRPAVPAEVAQYHARDRKRLAVKPGLTCIWQVSGRSSISFPEQVRMDLEYIESMSLKTDLKLLFKTIPAVVLRDGAR